MSEFIPIYEYVKLNNISEQNVYRWIRERKFTDDEVRVDEVKVKRIRIKKNAKPKLARARNLNQ